MLVVGPDIVVAKLNVGIVTDAFAKYMKKSPVAVHPDGNDGLVLMPTTD